MLDFAVYLKRFASAFPHSSFGWTEDRSPPIAKPLLRNKIVIGKLRNSTWDTIYKLGTRRSWRGGKFGWIDHTALLRTREMTPCFELSWKQRTPINAKHSGMTSAMQKRRACTRVEIPGGSPIPKGKSVGIARNCSLPEISNFVRRRDRSLLSSFAA